METRTRTIAFGASSSTEVEFYERGRLLGTLLFNPRDGYWYLWRGHSVALLGRYGSRALGDAGAERILPTDASEFIEEVGTR
jgi:hypothetical protein